MSLVDLIYEKGQSYQVHPLDSEADADGDGFSDPTFGSPVVVTARHSSGDAVEYARTVLGHDSVQRSYYFTVPDAEGVDVDGRVFIAGRPYRVTFYEAAQSAPFTRYLLIPDDRATDQPGGVDDSYQGRID